MDKGYEVKWTKHKGEGVFATRTFSIGEMIIKGIIDKVFKENTSHTSQVAENKFVFYKGDISKVNHSCEPNCGLRANLSGGHDFVAMKPIVAGEEVLFDYAIRNYRIENIPAKCMCRTSNCRERITGWKNLPKNRKEKYKDFAASYLLELDKRENANGD